MLSHTPCLASSCTISLVQSLFQSVAAATWSVEKVWEAQWSYPSPACTLLNRLFFQMCCNGVIPSSSSATQATSGPSNNDSGVLQRPKTLNPFSLPALYVLEGSFLPYHPLDSFRSAHPKKPLYTHRCGLCYQAFSI